MIPTLRKLKEDLRESVIEISERKITKEKKLLKEGKISDEEFVKFCDENTKGTAKKLKDEIEKIKNAENLTGKNIKINRYFFVLFSYEINNYTLNVNLMSLNGLVYR